MTETTKRILALQKAHYLNDHQLEIGAGLPVSSIQAWTKGKKRKDGTIAETAPSLDSIVKIARFFNVSADYLLCLTDEMKPLESREVGQMSDNFSAEIGQISDLFKEQRFVDTAKVYNELPDEYREKAYAFIAGIAYGLGINVEKILGK